MKEWRHVCDRQSERGFPCYTFFWLVSLLVNSFSFFKLSSHSSVLAERQHKRKIGRDFPILFCFVSPSVQTHTDVPVVEAKWKKKKSCTTFSKGGRWYAPHFCLSHTHTHTHTHILVEIRNFCCFSLKNPFFGSFPSRKEIPPRFLLFGWTVLRCVNS